MLSLVQCSPAEYHKNLHHWWRIIWREIVLLVCLNTFAEEMSEAHSDKLKKLSFLRRQCAVLSPVGCSPAEYHKKFTPLVENYLERDCATEYFCKGNEQSSF